MVVTDSLLCSVLRVKNEMESDTDTLDTQTDNSSCPSSPTPPTPPSSKYPTLPMDTVILVAKAKDGSKKSLVFRSLLKNRRAPGRIEKIRIIKTAPVADIKNASLPMRTNLKQHLDRQQVYQQEQREQQFSRSFKANTHLTQSPGITIPRVITASQVPVNVLQVKTQLQNPTKYHVEESQKRKVQHFLSNSHHGTHIPIQSLPTNHISMAAPHHNNYHMQAPNSAPQPDLSSSFLTDTSDPEYIPPNFDLLKELSVEPLELDSFFEDSDLIKIQPTIGESLRDDLSQTGGLLHAYDGFESDGMISSCSTGAYSQPGIIPTGMSAQDDMWRKERMKKDNHNIIERRRRFNINDRIKELGGLLPKTVDPDLRQNKGTILKASVEYIKSLQEDQRRFRMIMEQKKKADNDLRRVLLRLNQLQFLMKSHGIENPLLNDVELMSSLSSVMTTENLSNAQMSSMSNHLSALNNTKSFTSLLAADEIMDECFPTCGDPMLLSDAMATDNDDQSILFSHFHS